MRAFTSCNPGTGEIYFTRPSWSEAELLARIASLKHFQKGWSESGIDARSDALKRLASALSAAKNQLAGKISQEVGRRTLECKSEIDRSIDLLHYYARSAPMTLMPKKVKTEATRSELFFEPLGLVLAIMPWNYPVWQVLRFAVPALVAGNACLVKPAPSVPQSTALLLDIVHSTGIQAMDVAWINEEHVEEAIRAADAVAFTGSTDVGRIVAAAAGKHIKKTVLELGGSNPLVVLKDADIHVAARDACYSRFRDAGQSCNAVKRMIVVPEIAEAFIAELIAEASKLKMGIQDDPNASLPPLARADLRETLHAQVLDAT
ncbi:MAG: aldehyde dehydrogenase family protein, partial [Pseudomonadota bacterium]|nr:aldehyde dehydrogenase family protein [Pseudomonadota bacterium]